MHNRANADKHIVCTHWVAPSVSTQTPRAWCWLAFQMDKCHLSSVCSPFPELPLVITGVRLPLFRMVSVFGAPEGPWYALWSHGSWDYRKQNKQTKKKDASDIMLINMSHMQTICAKSNSKLLMKYYSAVMHKRWMLFCSFLGRIELNVSAFFCFTEDQGLLVGIQWKCLCWSSKNIKILSKNEVAVCWHVTHSLHIICHCNPALSALYGQKVNQSINFSVLCVFIYHLCCYQQHTHTHSKQRGKHRIMFCINAWYVWTFGDAA